MRAMGRLRDYLRFLVWNAGLGYLALGLMTFWTLDYGAAVFGHSGGCHPAYAKVLFYWMCDADSPLAILAALANGALTLTVWAPVYVAAATVYPPAVIVALPIMLTHALGLPAALLVAVRSLAALFGLLRRLAGRSRGRFAPPASRGLRAQP